MMAKPRRAMNRTYRATRASWLTLPAQDNGTAPEFQADAAGPMGEREGQIER
jgi:hypothetical protein